MQRNKGYRKFIKRKFIKKRVALNKVDKDYYKLIKTKSPFNNNYIEYESKGDKNKKFLT